jgi:MATE family multidrug resistance protein
MSDSPLTRLEVLKRAWPFVFANATVPLAGVADTAVITRTGDAADIAGVGLGALLLSVLHGSFYFLRMGTTGLTAQAHGAEDRTESQRVMLRSIGLAMLIGATALILRGPLVGLGLALFPGEAATEAVGGPYFMIRMFGLTGALIAFAATGWLIGMGRSLSTLAVYVLFSVINITLDIVFVLHLGWGPEGVAWATVIAEWSCALVALFIVWRTVMREGGWEDGARDRHRLLDPGAIRRLLSINLNLMIRTWTLTIGFFWFGAAGARESNLFYAGNVILLQVVTVWAFVLDAFAFVAETESGRAAGRRSLPVLRRAARLTGESMLIAGALFAGLTLLAGPPVLTFLVQTPSVRDAALAFLPYCALVPLVGAAAWLLDGLYIGATSGRILRNAGIASLIVYLIADTLMSPFGAHGVWMAFMIFYIARAGALAVAWPALERRIAP